MKYKLSPTAKKRSFYGIGRAQRCEKQNSPRKRSSFRVESDRPERLLGVLDDVDDRLRRQPRAVLEGGGDDVALRLVVEALAGDAEVIGVLVHELTLLAIHAVERVRAALLLRLLKKKMVASIRKLLK